MEKKKSKGLLGSLFAPKQNSGCCNIQFEEITDKQNIKEEKVKDDSENMDNDNKDNVESEKGNNTCCCGSC